MPLDATPLINSFNAGELSPFIDVRSDINKYYSGCRTLENFVPLAEGGAARMPGSMYVTSTKSNGIALLVPFHFSTTQAYVLEFGNQYIRFYMDNGQIVSGGTTAYEIASPYLEADLFDLDVQTQSADVLYIFHEDYEPRKLSRTGHTSWTLEVIGFEGGPFLEEETGITFTASATSGLVTVSASASYFQESMEDSLLRLKFSTPSYAFFTTGNPDDSGYWATDGCVCVPVSVGQDDNYAYAIVENSSLGTQSVTRELLLVVGKYYEVLVYLKDDTGGWTGGNISIVANLLTPIIAELSTATAANYTLYRLIFKATETNNKIKLNTALGSGEIVKFDVVSVREVNEASPAYGIVKISSVLSDTSALCTVQTTLGVGSSVAYNEAAWSGYRGYPACGTFHDSRLVCAGSTNQPQTLWFSVIGLFEDFTGDATDDSASFSYTLVSKKVDKIRWLASQDFLMAGTVGGIWKVGGASATDPLTQDTVNAKRQIAEGVSTVQPQDVDDGLLWLNRFGNSVNQLSYSFDVDKYIAPDLTRIAKHITQGATQALSGVVQMAFQRHPFPILWAVRADGQLLGLTYNSQEQIYGWSRVVTDGQFESIAVISKDNEEDQLWAIVNRTIGGATKRYVEYFKPHNFFGVIEDCFFLHSGKETSSSGLTVNGLSHLNGESVSILANGYVHPNCIVTSGLITLTYACATLNIGLGYDSILEPMKLHAGSQRGTARGKKQKIKKMTVCFYETSGGKFGPDRNSLSTIPFSTGGANVLKTEDIETAFPGDWGNEATLTIVQDSPLPMTVLGIVPYVTLEES